MNNDLKNLIALQEIDIRIIELEKSKEEFPLQVDGLEKAISEAQAVVKSKETELNELIKEKKNIEEQIINTRTSLDKSQERLNSIKTNKEYDAVHTEIETQKHILASADKRLEKYSADIEYLQTVYDDAQNACEEITAKNQPQIDELKTKIAGIDSAIAEVRAEREKLASEPSKNYLRAYDHIRANRKNGKAISIVNSTDRTCTICYQMLQPQVVNEMRKGTDIIYCQNCGSIFIWEQNVI